ncbi:MAG TPA: prenyltransferase/squalene oxidase repeat-containing protein [Anaerolineales bacterium]|nr:prenyltransferase/squalene oxidase repeat-containing protein [Anaerolineales bacterium]
MTVLANVQPKHAREDRSRIEAAIARAVEFLEARQLPYGEFKTLAASDRLLKRKARFDSSPFVTAWVVDCLRSWQSPAVRGMMKNAVRYLRREMEGPGLWRYWSSRNEAHDFLPPDVDDTCCVSAVLQEHGLQPPPNERFILANRNNEGLFFTWIVPRDASPKRMVRDLQPLMEPAAWVVWSMQGLLGNVDPGVNANAVMYLGERAETRPAIDYLIGVVCGERSADSPSFYPDAITLHYLVSRAYARGVAALGETRGVILQALHAQQSRKGVFKNELLTAFAICTLLNFHECGRILDKPVNHLLKCQRANGGWRGIGAFLGPAPYYGSDELTTAVCIQALARYHATLS